VTPKIIDGRASEGGTSSTVNSEPHCLVLIDRFRTAAHEAAGSRPFFLSNVQFSPFVFSEFDRWRGAPGVLETPRAGRSHADRIYSTRC